MGITLCKLHGRSEIAFVCPHIRGLVNSGSRLKDFLELKVDFADSGIALPYNFCPTCVETYKLPITTEVLSDAASEDYEIALDIAQPVCENCLADAKNH
jgi:hypothetical protein